MAVEDIWINLAEVLRSIEPNLEAKIAYCRANPPDPIKQPVTSAIVAAYISRMELELATLRRGASGLKNQFSDCPNLVKEVQEFESWLLRKIPGFPSRKLTGKNEDGVGDWFVSKMGYSYSQAKRMIRDLNRLQSGKGAPSKRPETLKMMDARIRNNWTYKELAHHKCDCGARDNIHTAHCEDRIRKRIKELEAFLTKYNIPYSHPATGEK